MKSIRITIAIILLVSIFGGINLTEGRDNPRFVERILVLEDINTAWSQQDLQTETSKSQVYVIDTLEELLGVGDVIDYQSFWIQNMVSVTCKISALDRLLATQGVIAIMPNIRIYADKMKSSNSIITDEKENWNLEMIGATGVWETGNFGEGAVIGVLDSGCDSTHPELQGKIESYAYIDNYGRKSSIQKVATDSDGHGTSVCSVIAGETTGVAPKAKLIVGAVIPGGSGSLTQILGGMQWILNPDGDYKTDDFPKVVNMSFGAPGALKYLESGIDNLLRMGIIPVASAGNNGEGSTSNPGNFPDVLAVGAVDFTEGVTDFSGGADVSWEYIDDVKIVTKPDLVAPGEAIRVATPHRTYDLVDGTSSAAPHVAGLCALLLAENPGMAPEDIRHALISGAKDLGKEGKDRRYGYGLVQAEESLLDIEGREEKNLKISWSSSNILWGDIEVRTSDRTYTVSRDQADEFTFLSLPGDEVKVWSFGYEESVVDGDEVELVALPTFDIELTTNSTDLGGISPCKVRFPGTPLPFFDGPDGHVTMKLPVGTHSMRIYSFGHADEDMEIIVSTNDEIEIELTPADIAFIDDRKSIFGIPPEPIQGRMRRALDEIEMPYFIWSTRDGRVTASQLSRFPYVVWNLGGSPSEKIVKVLSGYMDMGGKLILTSGFYGASYLGESDSTVFLASYFDCYPTDNGGSAIKHWSGENWETVAIETPSFLRSSELVPIGEKANPMFYYTGFKKQTVAGIRVSTLKNQGVILGFTIPEVSSDRERSWLVDYCISSFDETTSWSTKITSDGKNLDGVATINGETVQFKNGKLFVAHIPNQMVSIKIASFGFEPKIFNLHPSSLPENIELESSVTDTLSIQTNTDGYLLFHDVPVDPMQIQANSKIELPRGSYELTFCSRGFTSQKISVSVPGELSANLMTSPPHILIPEGYTGIANTLSTLGLAHAGKENIKAEDIISSSVFLWSSSGRIKENDRELISEIKTALKCNASVLIAGPEVVKQFGSPVELESIATKIYAIMGKGILDGMLISITSATNRYGISIPVLAGGETLANFIGGSSAITRYGDMIVCGFEFEKIDLDIVKEELVRLLISELGMKDGILPRPRLSSPSSPTNMNPLVITGFSPPGSRTILRVDAQEFKIRLDPEGFFSQKLDLGDGSYKIKIIATKVGETSQTEEIPLVVDRTPPQIQIISPRGGRTFGSEIEVIASCIGSKSVTIDGAETKVSNNSISKKIPAGSGVVMFSAVDVAGNKIDKILRYIPDSTFAVDATSSPASFEIAQISAGAVLDESDSVFRPFQPATKGEVAVWLTRALGLEPKPGFCPYPDVAKDSKIEPYIGALFSASVLSGKGNYQPDTNTTCEFLLQMIANRYGLSHNPALPTFPDLRSDSPWYKGVEGCVKAKIINPKDKRVFVAGNLNPGSGIKREQVAVILYWVMKHRARNGE